MITTDAPGSGIRRARGHHLRAALRLPHFRRLFGVRLSAQFGDGVFQASLAGAVLFSPERQAHAADIAMGFAILLLPYSIIGPFAGVLIDRWRRQRILIVANGLRIVAILGVALEISAGLHGQPFYASALVVLSVSRFFLAAMSASLPHVIAREELVTANALSTTLGAVATTTGGGAAIGVRALVGDSSIAYAMIAAAAVVPYLVSALVARGFARDALGPDAVERGRRETLPEVARGLLAGARHLRSRRPAFLALGAVTVHRVCYGLFAVSTLLLFRRYFHADGPLRVGLPGLAQIITALAIGGALAAFVTPAVTRAIGYARWSAILFAASGVVQIALVLPYQLPLHVLAAVLLGFCAQAIKICADTVVQRTIDDEFRGRVFALYDTLFNLALVLAATLTAVAIPDSGHAPAAVVVIGVVYLVVALAYSRLTSSHAAVTACSPTTA